MKIQKTESIIYNTSLGTEDIISNLKIKTEEKMKRHQTG